MKYIIVSTYESPLISSVGYFIGVGDGRGDGDWIEGFGAGPNGFSNGNGHVNDDEGEYSGDGR